MLEANMSTPYLLPEGNVHIALSGGRTSAYMLREILKANGNLPSRVQVVFCNTGREMPQTLDFVAEIERRWSQRIVWLEYQPQKPLFKTVNHNSAARDGAPFEALIERRKYLPHVKSRFCTMELKVLTAIGRGCQRSPVFPCCRAANCAPHLKGA